MRHIIFLILTILSVNAFAGSEENVTVRQAGEQYIVNYYNYEADIADYFAKAGLQGSGYTWGALVKAAITTESPELLEQIEISPEGGTFIAYNTNEAAAKKVKSVIGKLSADLNYRKKMIKIASDGGYIE